MIASPPRNETDSGPPLSVPQDLQEPGRRHGVQGRHGYVGARLLFDGLTFNQLNDLATVSSQAQGRFELNLRRIGDRVLVRGRADLTSIAVDKAHFSSRCPFPGRVINEPRTTTPARSAGPSPRARSTMRGATVT